MAKVFPIQVNFPSPEERKEMRDFCRSHFGRTFSAQVTYMLKKAKREAEHPTEAPAGE